MVTPSPHKPTASKNFTEALLMLQVYTSDTVSHMLLLTINLAAHAHSGLWFDSWRGLGCYECLVYV